MVFICTLVEYPAWAIDLIASTICLVIFDPQYPIFLYPDYVDMERKPVNLFV